MNYINDDDFVILDEEYIEFQKPTYNDAYIDGATVGQWVYDDGEVLVSQSCVEHWYATSQGEEQEKYRQIFEHLEALNSRD